MIVKSEAFKKNSLAALTDQKLQLALKSATSKFVALRNQAVSQVDGWEQMRSRAHEIKRDTIEHLDVYLESFSARVEENGGRVYWARNADDACRYIVSLARDRGLQRVVKSKSMATEEIGLNHALEEARMEVVETDLGEYIIQLLHDSPSHILAPAIHKSRRDVATLFAEKLGIEYTEEVERLTAAARAALRHKFLDAEIGISGVNFGVAETGTIVIVENEGNARLTTSLPRIHIAIMGIERLIPRFEDLSLFLALLPRSATGQKLSSYVSLITGVKRQIDFEGPEEFHLVLLDNGRSRILADPVQRESLCCIRCSACLNVCPVYQKVGGHAYGWVYPGPIGALITPQFVGYDRAQDLPFASSLCGACKDVCPVKINIPHLLLDGRSKVKMGSCGSKAHAPFSERLAMKSFAFIMRHPRLYRLGRGLARAMQKRFVADGYVRAGKLGFLSPWTRTRDFPALAGRSFKELWELESEQRHE